MAKEPEPPKPISWNVYKIASKAVWLGEVEAPDEAAVEFKMPANRADGDTAMTRRKGEITGCRPSAKLAVPRGAPGRNGTGPHRP